MDEERRIVAKELKLMLTNGFLPASRKIPSQYGRKLSSASEKYKGEGNNLYLSKNHDGMKHKRILSLYNQSIAFAPKDSESLATAYGNKSALLRHVCKYAECISEIDKALGITKSHCLKIKLLCRKAECLAALDSPDYLKNLEKAKFILCKLDESKNVKRSLQKLISKTESRINEKILEIPQKDKHREQLISLMKEVEEMDTSNFVEVQYSKKFGVHLIAARDFKPGEIIIVEKPHCGVVNAIYKHSYIYCGNCTRYLWKSVPCDHCTWCMFCSDECKNQAWEEYHDMECDVVSCILALGNFVPFPLPQLTLRIVLRAIRQAGSIVQLCTDVETIHSREDYKSFSTDGKVEDYKRIYSLRGGLYPHELEEYSKVSSLIVVLLAKHSSILGNRYEYHQIEKLMKNEEAITLGALLLKTSKIVVLNCQGVWGYNDLCRNNPGGGMCTSECCGKKAYMAPSMSLIPLSCCPNVSRGVMNDDRGITFTLSPIKKGDQLFSSIYSVYKLAPKAQRQKVYRKRYGCDCECQACENDWTEADFLTERTIESFMSESKMMEKFNAAKTSRAMKRNSDIGTLLQMKELVQDAWKYYALPSDILINSVKAFLEMVDIIYCKSGSKMPSKCSNCD